MTIRVIDHVRRWNRRVGKSDDKIRKNWVWDCRTAALDSMQKIEILHRKKENRKDFINLSQAMVGKVNLLQIMESQWKYCAIYLTVGSCVYFCICRRQPLRDLTQQQSMELATKVIKVKSRDFLNSNDQPWSVTWLAYVNTMNMIYLEILYV